MKNQLIYQTSKIAIGDDVQFLFESVGRNKVIKIIEFSPIQEIGDRTVYNIAFGDFDHENQIIRDDINSNNGDMYVVFNTVLNTVPLFFELHPRAVIAVSGSDSDENFIKECLKNCKKKCTNNCKNSHRRIKTYLYFINKHFDELCSDFIFFGRNKLKGNEFVQYIPTNDYHDILVYKKK